MDNYEHTGRRFADQNPSAISVAHGMQHLLVNLYLGWQMEPDPALLSEYGFVMDVALQEVEPKAKFLRPCGKPFGFTFKVDRKVYRISLSRSGAYAVEKIMEVLS